MADSETIVLQESPDSRSNLLRKIWDLYEIMNTYLEEHGDPRTRNLFLMKRTDGMVLITVAYLLFVYFGPKMMKNRKALTLRPVMMAYNFINVIMSLWMFLELLINSRISKYDYWCAPYTLSYKPSDLRIVDAMYLYFISKGIEYLDTVFMILKKKQNQVTFLHVYHHIFMFPATYFGVALAPCGQALAVAMVNSFIHVVMYTYYGLALFPVLQKYLWWKKYLTQLQLIQFVSLITISASGLLNNCTYPLGLYYSYLAFATSLVFLFLNFYIRSYNADHKKSRGDNSLSQISDNKKHI